MPKNISIIGTEFFEQTLVDKNMEVTFCNPPYSEYVQWVLRLVRESSSQKLYLVIPKRWRDNAEIQRALESRELSPVSLGEFDFENADRAARAKIEIIRIDINADKNEAFDAAIEDMLPELKTFHVEKEKETKEDRTAVMPGRGIIESLVEGYNTELAELFELYRTVVKIKPSLLKGLGIGKQTIVDGLRSKINGLKNKYWQALFDHLKDITRRMATKQKKEFLQSLQDNRSIDFTDTNIHAILIWIVKWSCDFYDEQLIDLYQNLARSANVETYKSNEKVFTKNYWRYLRDDDSHFKLCYRLVLECCGGINTSPYSFEAVNGLAMYAVEFLDDFITVANNLGFDCDDSPRNHEWKSNKRNTLKLRNGETLMDVKAFKNGNLHIFMSKEFTLALNIRAGKLLGWVKSPQEAMDEMQLDESDREQVTKEFAKSYQITTDNILKIEG